MDELNIKSETIDKAIDVISDSTKETRNTLDKRTAGGINKLFDLLWATPLGIKADVYIQSRPYKMKCEMEKMKARYDKIPDENKTEPSSYIALKGVQELTYCLDEDHLREMFSNLLIADMDNRKQSKVLPAYIEIVKQLSKKDAELLSNFARQHFEEEPILKIKFLYSDGGFRYSSNNIALIIDNDYIVLDSVILDNLSRLKIIELTYKEFKHNNSIYENAFNAIAARDEFKILPQGIEKLDFSKGLLRITDFGKNFIDICLS